MIGQDESLKIVIVGHVDHGKSTLIGRLFYDTGRIPESRLREIEATCKSQGREFEFAYLMDALEEERDQNITIDTASTFFATALRQYVIIDAPGHKQFLKNMITGAAGADAALLLVDGAEGVQEQTRRHAHVLSLLGIRQVIVAVNKLDMVGYSRETFQNVENDIRFFLHALDIIPTAVIPISAREGENVARRSGGTPWYEGPTILEALDGCRVVRDEETLPFRMPVQDIYKWDNRRLYVGRVETGVLRPGDNIVILPSGRESRVKTVEKWRERLAAAKAGECIGITTEDELFVERGEVIAHRKNPVPTATEVRASVFWMAERPLEAGATVKIKLATAETQAVVMDIEERLDSSTLEITERRAAKLNAAEVATVLLALQSPLAAESYKDNARLGRFVIEEGYQIGGGGIIRELARDGLLSGSAVNLDDRLIIGEEGSVIDLTGERDELKLSVGSYFLDYLRAGNSVLIRLKGPRQMQELAFLAYEKNLRFTFARNGGGIDIGLSKPPERTGRPTLAEEWTL